MGGQFQSAEQKSLMQTTQAFQSLHRWHTMLNELMLIEKGTQIVTDIDENLDLHIPLPTGPWMTQYLCKVSAEAAYRQHMSMHENIIQFLQWYHEGEAFLQQTVPGDETWVHYYEPASKHSMEGKRHCPGPRNSKVCLLPAK
jgi:hypothetical protein